MDGGTDEKGGVSRAALSAHSKTLFYSYAYASLHLRTATYMQVAQSHHTGLCGPGRHSPVPEEDGAYVDLLKENVKNGAQTPLKD